ncbi:AIR synthase-related protein [Halocatena halophila]|uniref:AIR synthase-related protein n=1 Tax=Halocatena halophila TaxID=2814576 RepID=UPI002ED0EB80
MDRYGKIDSSFFTEYVYPHLGADRDDVALGPTAGVDFGIVDVGGQALVTATDPISILPELGFERAAQFALDIVLTDVAVSGLSPDFLSVSFTLPPSMTDEQFRRVWTTMDAMATELNIAIVTGHTARYEGCSFPWVGGATAFAVGDHDAVIRPNDSQPGDQLIVSTGPGAEAVGLLTTLFGDQLDLPPATLETARKRLGDTRGVADALSVAEIDGVTAIHDITEGGLQGALCELANSTGRKLRVEREAVPIGPGVEPVCTALDLDPWQVTSAGSLLVSASENAATEVVDKLRARGTRAAIVGSVTDGAGVWIDGERVDHPGSDPSWDVYAKLANEK